MKKLYLLVIALLFLAGCAAKSGVVSAGPDTYLITRQAKTHIFANFDNLEAEALHEATEYCLSQNKNIRVVKTSVSPAKIFGNLPRAAVQFMCLEKTDTDSPSP